MPTVEFPPAVPFTIQVTAVLLVPDTDALNCCDWPTCRVAELGDTVTEIPGELSALPERGTFIEFIDSGTMERLPFTVPVEVGVNETTMVEL